VFTRDRRRRSHVQVAPRGRQWRLTARGASHIVDVLPAHVAELSRHMIEKIPPDLSKYLLCPMPGLLTALNVVEGDRWKPASRSPSSRR
jgi:propionyl-CoA carboxylase alpha chain